MAIIGIDLGTSNSAAAVLRGGRPVIIPSAEGVSLGGKAFPSYVAVNIWRPDPDRRASAPPGGGQPRRNGDGVQAADGAACNGSGARSGTMPRRCEACDGSGRQVTSQSRGDILVRQITLVFAN